MAWIAVVSLVCAAVALTLGLLVVVWRPWRAGRHRARRSVPPTAAQVSWANTRRQEADVEATIITPAVSSAVTPQWDPDHLHNPGLGRLRRHRRRP